MARRSAVIIAIAVALPLAALVGAVALRAPLLEAVLEQALRARGIPGAQLAVRQVGLRSARVADLRLGAQGEVSARDLRVSYTPAGLLAGRVEDVTIEGLSLALDLTGDEPPLGTLQPLVAAGEDGGAQVPLPPLSVAGGRIVATTPLGPVTGRFDGDVAADPGGGAAAVFTFDITGAPGRARGTLDATIGPAGKVSGRVSVDQGALNLPGARVQGFSGDASFVLTDGAPERIDVRASLDGIELRGAAFERARLELALSQTRLAVTADLRGAEDLVGTVVGRIEVEAERPLASYVEGGLPGLIETPPAGLTGRVAVDLSGVSFTERVQGLSGTLQGLFSTDGGAFDLRLEDDARIEAAAIAPAWLRGLGVPAEVAALLGQGAIFTLPARGAVPLGVRLRPDRDGADLVLRGLARLTLPAGAVADAALAGELRLDRAGSVRELAFSDVGLSAGGFSIAGARIARATASGHLAGTPDDLAGEADLTLALDKLTMGEALVDDASLALPLALRLRGETISAHLRKSGRIAARGAAYGDTVTLAAPVDVAIEAAEVRMTRPGADGLSIEHAVTLAPGDVRLRLARDGEAPWNLHARARRLRLSGGGKEPGPYLGRAEVEDARLELVEYRVAAETLSATARFGTGAAENTVSFAVGALRHLGAPALFAPLATTGQARQEGSDWKFTAQASGAAGALRLALDGRHRIADGRGEATLTLAPLAFRPDGLQPAALSPVLGDLRAARGAASASARLAWRPDGLEGTADLSLQDIGFDSDEAQVEGLALDLRLDSLVPPGSPPGQRLAVRRVDPGLPLTDLSLRFQVQPADPPRLAIETAQAVLSGGRFSLRDVIVDPAAERRHMTLRIDELDLDELFRLLAIDGLTGEGRLSGAIPVVVDGASVAIQDGRLAAAGPGVVRFRSAQAAELLGGAGESVDLMLRALEDFHYDELSLTVNKTASEDARLALVMLGRNPNVLEGHPFRFNINLEGNPEKLVAALRDAYRLSNRLIRRMWMPGG